MQNAILKIQKVWGIVLGISVISYVRTIFRKTKISYPLIHRRMNDWFLPWF